MSEIESRLLGHKNLYKMLARPKLLGCAIIFLYIGWSLMSCHRQKGDALVSNIDSLDYSSLTTGVETLISDSGVTKYKLTSPRWLIYDSPEEKWYFPEGLYVEQFDTLFNIEASIKADTAYYYKQRQLWELKNNVEVLNRQGQRFFGQSLFWDEVAQEVYSHEHIRIERSTGQLIESDFGFRSNQNMTRYELYSSHGHIDVEDKPIEPNDSTSMPPSVLPVPSDTALVPNRGEERKNKDVKVMNPEDLKKLEKLQMKKRALKGVEEQKTPPKSIKRK